MTFVLDAFVTMTRQLKDDAAWEEAYPFAALNRLGTPDTAAVVPMTCGLEIANVIAR